MAKRPLPTPEELRQLLRYEPDTGKLFWRERTPEQMQAATSEQAEWASRRWQTMYANQEAGSFGSRGYRVITVNHRIITAHRVMWAIHYGEWPNVIDHIDGDKSNNRIENLRNVTALANSQNVKPSARCSSGVKGVRWDKERRRWRASVRFNGTVYNLGSFIIFDDAEAVVLAKRKEIGGYTERHSGQSATESRHACSPATRAAQSA